MSIREKKNTGYLEKLNKLKPITFTYKNEWSSLKDKNY